MAKGKGDEELPLTEHDDATHWIGKLTDDKPKKPSADRQTHSKPTKGKG